MGLVIKNLMWLGRKFRFHWVNVAAVEQSFSCDPLTPITLLQSYLVGIFFYFGKATHFKGPEWNIWPDLRFSYW